MKIKNSMVTNQRLLTIQDVEVGEVFRLVGDNRLLFNTEDSYCILETGEYIPLDEDFPVEIIDGYFQVEGIISEKEG